MSDFRCTTLLMVLLVAPAVAQDRAAQDRDDRTEDFQANVLLVGKEVVPGRVVEVGDDGTMRVASDDGELGLRLLNVALPRENSALRRSAVDLLRERLVDQWIEAHVVARPEDSDLALGYPVLAGHDVRFELVDQGLARCCPGHARDAEIEAREQVARDQGKGIWSGDDLKLVPACPGRRRMTP